MVTYGISREYFCKFRLCLFSNMLYWLAYPDPEPTDNISFLKWAVANITLLWCQSFVPCVLVATASSIGRIEWVVSLVCVSQSEGVFSWWVRPFCSMNQSEGVIPLHLLATYFRLEKHRMKSRLWCIRSSRVSKFSKTLTCASMFHHTEVLFSLCVYVFTVYVVCVCVCVCGFLIA